VFLYVVQVIAGFTASRGAPAIPVRAILMPGAAFIHTFFTIIILVQLSLLFFKTTTSTELRDALSIIEEKIRRTAQKIPLFGRRVSAQAHAAKTFAVFLSCIPTVFEAWNRIDRAWRARGGKNGIAKMRALLPVFLSVCLHEASQKARALAAREQP
jgi:energy-coupling factor transporter transmembrane protein EcfT